MATLWEDMDRYSNEYYAKKDLVTGLKVLLKIVAEIGGMFAVVVLAMKALALLATVVSGWFAPLAALFTPAVMTRATMQIAGAYAQLPTEERRAVRALINLFHGNIHKFSDW